MSSEIAIRVEGLGKRFEIGDDEAGYKLLSETIADSVRSFGRRPKKKEFWALKDINFEVTKGQTLGIIGHNGAGKSTLLKILSRITPPTEGTATLYGRVGALLEVGTGFHPELTGRENIFLNGAILNMKTEEIRRKFDEIVAFADIGPFIDTPVKRYSSGMQMRLAFSVAAHLEPEILIIDEVLSVGDLAFQQKCLGRMEQAAREGRTIIFISHNLSSVLTLCDRAILLERGRIVSSGAVGEVVDHYVRGVVQTATLRLTERTDRDGTGAVRLTDMWFEVGGEVVEAPVTGADCEIVFSYETAGGAPVKNASFGATIVGVDVGADMIDLHSETAGVRLDELPRAGHVRCLVPRFPLPAGRYYLNLVVESGGTILDSVPHALDMTVAGGDFFASGHPPRPEHRTVLVDQSWRVEPTPPAADPLDPGEQRAAAGPGPLPR